MRESNQEGNKALSCHKSESSLTSGTKFITKRTQNESHTNGSCNSHNTRSPKIFLGQVKSYFDLAEKRSNSKPNEEGDEETDPAQVKCSHVGTGEVTKLDLLRFVVLVWVDFQGKRVVFLPRSLFR